MPPFSPALSGPSTDGASPAFVRATSPAKSRLTIRLPDLSAARVPLVGPPAGSPPGLLTVGSESQQDNEAAEATSAGQVTKGSAPAWMRQLPQKTFDLVRQPKFWLACVVAVAVQIVLALVMTPAEGVSDRQRSDPSAAHSWSRAPEEPARRILVPAAPVNVPDDHSETAPSVTTPMGPPLPLETSETNGYGNAERSAEETVEHAPAVRMADNPYHTNPREALPQPPSPGVAEPPSHVDQPPAQRVDGASLDGIAPLEPGALNENIERR